MPKKNERERPQTSDGLHAAAIPRKTEDVRSRYRPRHVEVDVFILGREADTITEPAPKRFPADLIPYLEDYMARGFNYGLEYAELKVWADKEQGRKKRRGAPMSGKSLQEGLAAIKLRQDDPALTGGEIARRVCQDSLINPGHRHSKTCTDRISKAVDRLRRLGY